VNKMDFLPIVKLKRIRRDGNPAGLFVAESHRILIAIALAATVRPALPT
jgi:hypothetical protein